MGKLRSKGAERATKTVRDARGSVLFARPSIRFQGRQVFDAFCGSRVSAGLAEIRLDVPNGEGFVCPRTGALRPVRRGCGRGCACLQCDAEPRRDGRPPKATLATCGCFRCQQRRQRRS
jgi:hypothetical protein